MGSDNIFVIVQVLGAGLFSMLYAWHSDAEKLSILVYNTYFL